MIKRIIESFSAPYNFREDVFLCFCIIIVSFTVGFAFEATKHFLNVLF